MRLVFKRSMQIVRQAAVRMLLSIFTHVSSKHFLVQVCDPFGSDSC